jgi:outer membrane immunogenic protein
MRKMAIAIFAVAAGTSLALAGPPAPAFDWSGFYAGFNMGIGQSTEDWLLGVGAHNPGFDAGNDFLSGPLGGVQAGYDVQTGNVVFGVQAGVFAAHLSGELSTPDNPWDSGCWGGSHATATCTGTVNALAELTARVGFLASPTNLFYLKGGIAAVQDSFTVDNGQWFGSYDGFSYFPVAQNRFGWTAGVGVQTALSDKVSLFGEFNYYDFGTQNVDFQTQYIGDAGFLGEPFTAAISQVLKNVRVGVNVKLN